MTQELFEKIVHQVTEEPLLHSLYFELQNGPLLDKRIFQWIKHFKSLNPQKKALLITNGELLSEFTLEEIIQSKLNVLIISLNAHTERTYNIINKGIDYKKVIENINFVSSHRRIKPKIRIRFALTKINQEEVYEGVRFWNKKGIRTVVKAIGNRAGGLEKYRYYKVTGKQKRIFEDVLIPTRFYHIKKIWKVCPKPFYKMCVLFNGEVIFCCNDWHRNPIIGNVNQNSLRSIWNSNRMNEMRKLILDKKYKQITPCSKCSTIRFK